MRKRIKIVGGILMTGLLAGCALGKTEESLSHAVSSEITEAALNEAEEYVPLSSIINISDTEFVFYPTPLYKTVVTNPEDIKKLKDLFDQLSVTPSGEGNDRAGGLQIGEYGTELIVSGDEVVDKDGIRYRFQQSDGKEQIMKLYDQFVAQYGQEKIE